MKDAGPPLRAASQQSGAHPAPASVWGATTPTVFAAVAIRNPAMSNRRVILVFESRPDEEKQSNLYRLMRIAPSALGCFDRAANVVYYSSVRSNFRLERWPDCPSITSP
jgi:hypothetical protein